MKNTSKITINNSSKTISLYNSIKNIDESNCKIVDNVHIENIEQNVNKEHVCSNNEEQIEQQEHNKENQKLELYDMDELQLLEAIHQLVHIFI